MSIFSDFQAISELKKLKKGKTASLSMSQIVCVITNMSDAKRNLPLEQYKDVYALFQEYRKCNTKLSITIDGYMDIAVKIIKTFDKIAPYEKYSGGNELEFSFMMQDIRNEINEKNIQRELFDLVDMFGNSNDDYINYLVENGKGLSKEHAKAFVGISITFERHGREEALRRFRLYIDYLINSAGENFGLDFQLRWSVSFLCGLLAANNIITNDESDSLSKHYTDLFNANILEQNKLHRNMH